MYKIMTWIPEKPGQWFVYICFRGKKIPLMKPAFGGNYFSFFVESFESYIQDIKMNISHRWLAAEHSLFPTIRRQLFHLLSRPTSFQHNSTTVWKPHHVKFHIWKTIPFHIESVTRLKILFEYNVGIGGRKFWWKKFHMWSLKCIFHKRFFACSGSNLEPSMTHQRSFRSYFEMKDFQCNFYILERYSFGKEAIIVVNFFLEKKGWNFFPFHPFREMKVK